MAMSCSRWAGSSERASASCLGLRVRARVCQVGLLRRGCGVVLAVVVVLVLGVDAGVGVMGFVDCVWVGVWVCVGVVGL